MVIQKLGNTIKNVISCNQIAEFKSQVIFMQIKMRVGEPSDKNCRRFRGNGKEGLINITTLFYRIIQEEDESCQNILNSMDRPDGFQLQSIICTRNSKNIFYWI
jgi:hypothetical protein